MTATTNTAPGSAGQNGAPKSLRWEGSAGGSFGPNEILMADGHKFVGHFYVDASDGVDVAAVLRLIAAAPDLREALRPLARIADAYDANELDDEARKFWGVHPLDYVNETPPEQIEIYQGRGGKRLLTLADCFAARAAIAAATVEAV